MHCSSARPHQRSAASDVHCHFHRASSVTNTRIVGTCIGRGAPRNATVPAVASFPYGRLDHASRRVGERPAAAAVTRRARRSPSSRLPNVRDMIAHPHPLLLDGQLGKEVLLPRVERRLGHRVQRCPHWVHCRQSVPRIPRPASVSCTEVIPPKSAMLARLILARRLGRPISPDATPALEPILRFTSAKGSRLERCERRQTFGSSQADWLARRLLR